MTNNNTHNPGHTIGGGYPFNGIASRANWSNRPDVDINDQGKVVFDPCDVEYVETVYDRDFFMFRMVEFAEALKTAETQIEDMLTDDPFSPELLGFELAHMNTDITMPPVTIFVSRYDDKYTLVRDNGELGTDTWDPARWILMEKLPDGSFKNTTLYLSCQRIAYAAFSALGIKMRNFIDKSMFDATDQFKEDVSALSLIGDGNGNGILDKMQQPTMDMNIAMHGVQSFIAPTHEVTYHYADPRGGGDISRIYKVNAQDNADAYRQAQKLLIEDYVEAGDVYTEALLKPGTESTNFFHAVNLNSQKAISEQYKEQLSPYLKSKGHTHAVNFVRGVPPNQIIEMVTVSAETDKDALTQAKFLLETDPDNPFPDVKFDELTIVK